MRPAAAKGPLATYGNFGLLLVAPAFFAANNIAARLADGVVPPAALSFWRWGVAFVVLAPLVWSALLARRKAILRELPRLAVLAAVGMTLVSLATYGGALATSATNIGLIYGAAPVLILLLDRRLTGAPIQGVQIHGLLACGAGLLVIITRGDPDVLVGLSFSAGDLIVAAGAAAWAVYSLLLKHWPSSFGTIERACLLVALGALISLPLYGAEHALGATVHPGMAALGIIFLVGVVAGALVIVAHSHLTAAIGPRSTMVLLYLIPLYNVVLAWLVLDESIAPHQIVGAALVLLGVFLSTRAVAPP
jgi:drug/metabolite transporter (DMT)-like permease